MGWNCQIYDSNFHFIYDEKYPYTIKSPYKDVVLGNNVWIANSCTVAKGTVLPPFSTLSSNSLANKDYSSYSTTKGNVFAGIPAVFIRSGVFRILNKKMEKKLFGYFKDPNNKIYTIEEDIDKNELYKEK